MPASRPARSKTPAHPGENPLFNNTLAFWALFHCRHARPPDTAFAA
ncbi:hypothetical protein [Pseudomonas sp. dw_358]|nr:hypothetical protein [Pseudomonas sp. dw_358]